MSINNRTKKCFDALYSYAKKYNRWDSTNLIPRVKITSSANGCMEGYFEVTEDVCNGASIMHGGFVTSMMDFLSVCGIVTHPMGAWALTSNMNVTFLNKGVIGDVIKFNTRPIMLCKKKILMECVLMNQKNNMMVAHGSVYFTFPNPKLDILKIIDFDPDIRD